MPEQTLSGREKPKKLNHKAIGCKIGEGPEGAFDQLIARNIAGLFDKQVHPKYLKNASPIAKSAYTQYLLTEVTVTKSEGGDISLFDANYIEVLEARYPDTLWYLATVDFASYHLLGHVSLTNVAVLAPLNPDAHSDVDVGGVA